MVTQPLKGEGGEARLQISLKCLEEEGGEHFKEVRSVSPFKPHLCPEALEVPSAGTECQVPPSSQITWKEKEEEEEGLFSHALKL